ncbi:hypothetical protein ATKI12_8465 [Kitasatospora sp. Ki12]
MGSGNRTSAYRRRPPAGVGLQQVGDDPGGSGVDGRLI